MYPAGKVRPWVRKHTEPHFFCRVKLLSAQSWTTQTMPTAGTDQRTGRIAKLPEHRAGEPPPLGYLR